MLTSPSWASLYDMWCSPPRQAWFLVPLHVVFITIHTGRSLGILPTPSQLKVMTLPWHICGWMRSHWWCNSMCVSCTVYAVVSSLMVECTQHRIFWYEARWPSLSEQDLHLATQVWQQIDSYEHSAFFGNTVKWPHYMNRLKQTTGSLVQFWGEIAKKYHRESWYASNMSNYWDMEHVCDQHCTNFSNMSTWCVMHCPRTKCDGTGISCAHFIVACVSHNTSKDL